MALLRSAWRTRITVAAGATEGSHAANNNNSSAFRGNLPPRFAGLRVICDSLSGIVPPLPVQFKRTHTKEQGPAPRCVKPR
jgi:hypothetical protein